jgi:hypothetical protein
MEKTGTMSYNLNPIEELQCVFLSYETEMEAAEIEFARREVLKQLGTKRWSRVVVDVTQYKSIPTAWELFGLSRSLSLDLPRNVRIALVIRPDQARHARLVESVARNGGIVLACFADAGYATAWVNGESYPDNCTRDDFILC